MQQLSNLIYADDFILNLKLDGRILPNPYRDYPYLIIENFLPQETCSQIVHYTMQQSTLEKAKVKRMVQGVVIADSNEEIRKTNIYELPKHFVEMYQQSFLQHQNNIENFFSIALTTQTEVQALEYTKGSFYIKHADDSNELLNTQGESVGFVQVAPQRKITTVLFTTSHTDLCDGEEQFEGGELIFNYLYDAKGNNVTLRPKAGTLIAFASNPVFSHEVTKVKEGYRLTLVQWHNGIIT